MSAFIKIKGSDIKIFQAAHALFEAFEEKHWERQGDRYRESFRRIDKYLSREKKSLSGKLK